MKRFATTIVSIMLCGLVVLLAYGGAKENIQDVEGQAGARGSAPGGYSMPTISANNFCGDFTTMTSDYGYLTPKKGLFLRTHDIRGAYGTNIYTYVMDGGNVQHTPGHFMVIIPRGGDRLEIAVKKGSMESTPSFTFIPTSDYENSAYVATEKVVGKYYYLCGDAETHYKFEDLPGDERRAEFRNLVDNYGEQLDDY